MSGSSRTQAAIISYCATVLVGKLTHTHTGNILYVEQIVDNNPDADHPLGRHLWDVPLAWITEDYLEVCTLFYPCTINIGYVVAQAMKILEDIIDTPMSSSPLLD